MKHSEAVLRLAKALFDLASPPAGKPQGVFAQNRRAVAIITLFALGLQFVACAPKSATTEAASVPFQTELGFKKISDPATPAFLVQASRAVFEIRMLADEKIEVLQTYDLTDPKYVDLEQQIQRLPHADDKEKWILSRQVQHCRKLGNEKSCTIFSTIEKATGFLAGGDGSMFWTNAHVVDRFLKLRSSLSKKSIFEVLQTDGRVPIFIFDQSGQVVFDAFDDVATVSKFDPPSAMARSQGSWFAEDTDFVGIQLSRKIGVPLRIGARAKTNDLLYRPGFAGCTGCADQPNETDPLDNSDRGLGKNSSGQGLYWSSGRLQSLETAVHYLGVIPSDLAMVKMDEMLFFSADGQSGFSGGPILNIAGEAVGVFAGSKPKMYGTTMLNLSRGVRPPLWR